MAGSNLDPILRDKNSQLRDVLRRLVLTKFSNLISEKKRHLQVINLAASLVPDYTHRNLCSSIQHFGVNFIFVWSFLIVLTLSKY